MKRLLTPLLALAIIFSVTIVTAKDSPDKVEKTKIEKVFEAPSHFVIEHKEAFKLDDAEYQGFVITNAGFTGASVVATIGIMAVLMLIVKALKRWTRLSDKQLNIGGRLLLASLILFASKGTAPLAGMVLAGIVMAFPSLKSWATQKRYSRLAEGEQDDDKGEDEELKAIKKIGDQVEGFKKLLGDKADKEQFTTLETAINELKEGLKSLTGAKIIEKMENINKQLTEVYEDVQKAKDNGATGNVAGKPMVSTKDVQDFINATFKEGRKTSEKAEIKINSDHVFKAAETFGYAAFFNGGAGTDMSAFTGRDVDPTLYQRMRKRNLILDHFPIESITVPKLIYLEKKEVAGAGDSGSNAVTGGADWIASGAQKPMRSFRVTTGEVEAKKLAIFGTVEDKLLRDVASLENWIREDFADEMRETYNDGLLNNNPGVDADAPLGLKTNAIQFAATAAFDETVTDPNYIDMIIAAAAKMSDLKEQPAKAFIAADVWYRIFSLKDADGRFLHKDLVYNSTTGKLYLAGIELVPADSEDVPSTHLLMVAANPGFKIKNYGPVVFERGLNGEDFRYDRTSYRGYQEVLSYIPEHRENTIMYDTWANIEAAITAPAS